MIPMRCVSKGKIVLFWMSKYQFSCALSRMPPLHTVAQVARETMLALIDPSDVESSNTAATVVQLHMHAQSKPIDSSCQRLSGYDEFGNDELDSLRQTVADLQQQVAMLQSELQKQRRSKGGK